MYIKRCDSGCWILRTIISFLFFFYIVCNTFECPLTGHSFFVILFIKTQYKNEESKLSNNLIYKNGLGHAAAYQVSGKPFATGSLAVPGNAGTPVKVGFPSVTSWFSICNRGTKHCRVGFSAAGVSGSNYFCIHEDNHPTDNRFDLKVTEIYLLSDNSSGTTVDVVAGLTSIETGSILNNWSGSVGVG